LIVPDTTIVNVGLPSIREDLQFSQTSLAWVVNAYMLTFGGFLLLGGRLGDHFGHRRLFVAGILLFSLASLACGLSNAKGLLVAAHSTGTGSPRQRPDRNHSRTVGLLAGALALLAAFLVVESRVRSPLMPLGLFRRRSLATANAVGVLWAAAMFAWFFLSALYLQLVLGYSPLQVGLGFLPANLIMAVLSLGLSARLVMRFGIKPPLVSGLALAAVGLARAPVHGHYLPDICPAWFCSDSARARPSIRCCWPRGDTSRRERPAWRRESSTHRS
jgi:MFS family permease